MNSGIDPQNIPSDKIWNRGFISIFIISMTFNVGQSFITALLGRYADILGMSGTQIGFVLGGFAIVSLFLRLFAGNVMEFFSRKSVLIFAMICAVISYIGYGFSHSFTAILIFRMIQGFSYAFGNACCMAMAASVIPKDKFSSGMGYFTCAQVLSQAAAPTVALWLARSIGYGNTFFIAAVVMSVSLIITFTMKSVTTGKRGRGFSFNNIIAVEAIVPAVIILLVSIGFKTINDMLVVSAAKQGIEQGIGLFFTVFFVATLITRPIVGRLIDRYGIVRIGVPGILMTVLSLVIISFADRLWIYLIAAAVNALGYGALQPALQGLCLKAVSEERRGAAAVTSYIGLDIGTMIGLSTAGRIADVFGYTTMWLLMTVPVILGIVVLIVFRKRISEIEKGFEE